MNHGFVNWLYFEKSLTKDQEWQDQEVKRINKKKKIIILLLLLITKKWTKTLFIELAGKGFYSLFFINSNVQLAESIKIWWKRNYSKSN